MSELFDRLAAADPRRRAGKLLIPTWLLSILFHASILAALLITIPRIARGLPVKDDSDAREVGIILKSEHDSEVVYQNPEQTYHESPQAKETPDPEFDKVQPESPGMKGDTPLPHLETPLVSIAGGASSADGTNLPKIASAPSGAMSKTTFWKVEATGTSFVFVIDRSASMSHRGTLELAKQELYQAIDQLEEKSKFQVVFYNTEAFMIPLGDGKLVEATQINKSRAKKEISKILPEGGTNHVKPLVLAFSLKPEVVYYLTDADMLSDEDVNKLTAMNRQARIPATVFSIEFGNGPNLSSNKPLRRLSADNDGTYSYLNVMGFGPSVGNPTSTE